MRSILLLIIMCLLSLPAFSQLKLQLGEYYLPGENVKKLQVSPIDYTIWALTTDHKVFYKKQESANFILYTPVSGMQISDLAGYSFDEMYFVAEPKTLIRIKNGVIKNFQIPNPLVSRISGIAIISPNYNTAIMSSFTTGLLTIGTNDDFYCMSGGSDVITQNSGYSSSLSPHHNYWSYLHSTFKGATFSSITPYNYCNSSSGHHNANLFGGTEYVSGYADLPPYPTKVNNGLMSLHPLQMFSGAGYSYSLYFDIWGTDKGLYAKYVFGCNVENVKNYFTEQVNGISEAYAISQINPQHYILAATDKGVQYTPSSIFGDDQLFENVNSIRFIPFTEFPVIKATDVLVDSRKDEGPPSQFVFVCDRVAWVSTINGIYKVYMQYDSDKFKKIKAPSFVNFGAGNPVFNADGDAVFDRCDDTQVIPVGLLNHPNNQLKISWFKNNVEIPEWLGKQNVDLKDEGKYHAELTSLCEGITLSSINFILQQSSDPQITFNYPDNIPVCEGESYSLSTVNVSGYSYRWYRNNELIDGAASSSYFATSPGKYRVEVSNCSGFFKPSKTVTITNPMLSVPVITADNASYCSGDVANLSVTNANQNTVKWYFNGTELTDHANQNTLATNKAGNYTVKFISGSCEKNADTYSLLFNAPIDFQIIKSIEGSLCYGQSVTLTSGVEAAAYHWSTGETSRAITVSSAGHYTVQLTSINNCISSQSVDVAVLPRVLLQPINDTVICTIAGESLRINAQPGFSGYNWNGQQTSNPYFDVSLPGTYTLEVITADGCTAQTIFKVTPWCKEIIIPNTFTPNNDGINDYWKIGGIENDATVSIQIFNRYGTRLLNFKGYGFEWDGRYNGVDLPTGTYYYIIKTKNSKDLLKGPITIIR